MSPPNLERPVQKAGLSVFQRRSRADFELKLIASRLRGFPRCAFAGICGFPYQTLRFSLVHGF